jgi:hypothetical protein
MKPIREANGTYPINLDAVVREILQNTSGDDTVETRFCSLGSIEGALFRKENSRNWGIAISTDIKSIGRRNFTWAHEIGHFVGHRGIADSFIDSERELHEFSEESIEGEANEFAAQLLMPQDIVRPFAKGTFTIESLDDLTDKLAVSRQAAGRRWIEVTEKLSAFVVSRDGLVIWGRASDAAFKQGIYFKSGMELPLRSVSANHFTTNAISGENDRGIWHQEFGCKECACATSKSGHVYTCLEFK